jgi:hypothetical protein
MDKRVELLKAVPGVQVVAVFGDRVYFTAPPQAVATDTPFKKVRAGKCDNTMLGRSLKKIALYPPIVHGEVVGDKLVLQTVDGLQRVLSSIENHVERMTFQLIFFESQEAALEVAVTANALRREPKDVDILGQFRAGLTLKQMLEITLVSESELRRLEKISRHPELDEAIAKKYVSASQLAATLDKCKDDYGRERRFVDYFTQQVDDAKKKAGKAQEYINKRKNSKIDSAQRKKAEVATHLKALPWADIKTALASDDQEGPLQIAKSEAPDMVDIRIGDDEEWSIGYSIFTGDSGTPTPWGKISLDALVDFRKSLPLIQKKIEGVIKQKRQEAAPPLHTENPDGPEDVEFEVEDQDVDFTAGDEEDE